MRRDLDLIREILEIINDELAEGRTRYCFAPECTPEARNGEWDRHDVCDALGHARLILDARFAKGVEAHYPTIGTCIEFHSITWEGYNFLALTHSRLWPSCVKNQDSMPWSVIKRILEQDIEVTANKKYHVGCFSEWVYKCK